MRVPFTAPQLPELDALPTEQRMLVLGRYSRSAEARRYIRFFQVSVLAAFALFFIAQLFQGWVRTTFFVTSPLLLIGGVALYRLSATRAIRAILHSTNFDHDHTPTA